MVGCAHLYEERGVALTRKDLAKSYCAKPDESLVIGHGKLPSSWQVLATPMR